MSKPREPWWGYAKNIIRQYPARLARPPGSLRQKEQLAVAAAVAETEAMPEGAGRLKIIRLVYWDKSHTVEGAGMTVPVSPRTAWGWHGEFVRCVGRHLFAGGIAEQSQEN